MSADATGVPQTGVVDVVGTGIVMVTGAGVSGMGTARLLADLDVDVLVVDDNTEAGTRVAAATGAEACTTAEATQLLEHAEHRISVVVTSPGWRPDTIPASARTAGSLVDAIDEVLRGLQN